MRVSKACPLAVDLDEAKRRAASASERVDALRAAHRETPALLRTTVERCAHGGGAAVASIHALTHAPGMAASARVQRIVSLVAELTPEERSVLAATLESAAPHPAEPSRARVADAIRRVVNDHPTILAALAK